jgi:hypothetical protein
VTSNLQGVGGTAVTAVTPAVPSIDATASLIWDGFELPLFGGLAATCGLLVALLVNAFQVGEKDEKWAFYLAMGLTFLLAIGGAAYRQVRPGRWGITVAQVVLCASIASLAIAYTVLTQRYYIVFFAAIQIVTTVQYVRVRGQSMGSIFATVLVVPIAWTLATSLVWWAQFDDLVITSFFGFIAFAIALCLALLNTSSESQGSSTNTFSLSHPWDVTALAFIGFASFRT